jgi:hypothetical protein
MEDVTLSTGAYYLKRGDTFDIEDHRMTHRLRIARSILLSQQIGPTWEHGEGTGLVGTGLLQREGHVCDYRCKAVWPEWASDRMFNLAFSLADEIQEERGGYHRHNASVAKMKRERV